MSQEQQDHIQEMINNIDSARGCSNFKLTKWEEDFFDSVVEQFAERNNLSDKQIECIVKIWEKI